jgi:hypothetical protein
MNKLVTSAATGIAQRTSRRGFLGRTGQLLLGVVGGSTLLALMTGVAQGAGCSCANPCFHWTTCGCGTPPRLKKHYDCPDHSCSDPRCTYSVCTGIAC